jgi:hypothetical protein
MFVNSEEKMRSEVTETRHQLTVTVTNKNTRIRIPRAVTCLWRFVNGNIVVVVICCMYVVLISYFISLVFCVCARSVDQRLKLASAERAADDGGKASQSAEARASELEEKVCDVFGVLFFLCSLTRVFVVMYCGV